LKKGDTGGFLKSPLTPLYERGENTPSAWRRHPSERGELTEQRGEGREKSVRIFGGKK